MRLGGSCMSDSGMRLVGVVAVVVGCWGGELGFYSCRYELRSDSLAEIIIMNNFACALRWPGHADEAVFRYA
eukprot:1992743-Rhodomonas_salina.1